MSIVQMNRGNIAPIRKVEVRQYVIPTSQPEADGTIEWDSTTLILVEVFAGEKSGIGFTYASKASGVVISETLSSQIIGQDAFDIPSVFKEMIRAVRNLGRPGVASLAISAVDLALWDLKSKLLDIPLAKLLGLSRGAVEVYGSGGFTSYSIDALQRQLGGWSSQGIKRVKMKVGAHPDADLGRVQAARDSIGADCELFVDANGAYSRKVALSKAAHFALLGVTWFEEPVSSDDLAGLRLIRDRAPPGMDIAAGEYGYDPVNLRKVLEAGAVDVLQIDATRCLGMTGFLQAAALAQAHFTDISAHCAPSMHVALGCSVHNFRHLEYFHDHARIEQMFFDGALSPEKGRLTPDLSQPGFGLELKRSEMKRYAA